MAKNAITDYDTDPANNTDVGGIGVQGNNIPSNFDNSQREIMSHLADMNAGTSPLHDTFAVADPADLTKKARIDAGNVTAGQTRAIIMDDADVDLSHINAVTGQVSYFAMSTAPTGFLKCNGAAISRTTYAALFAKIGTTFGVGDGSTTFNLPDLRGEFIRSLDDGRGIDGSRSLGSFQDHAANAYWRFYSYDYSWDGSGSRGAVGSDYADIAIGRSTAGSQGIHYVQTTDSGGAVSSETRPRNIAMLACIKY